MNPEFRSVSMLILIALLLSACGNSYSPAPGKIAATVNGEEIAVQQIKPMGGSGAGEMPGQAALEVLDKLIDQELLAQKALAKHLDRDAAVVREIEAAKQKILAKIYVDRSVLKQSVSPDEIVAFYREHPAWFEERHSYRLNELVATVGREQMAVFKAKVASSSRLDELAEWLQTRKLPFLLINSVKFSEQLPPEVLSRVAALKNGQTIILQMPGASESVSVIQMLQAKEAPLNLAEANALITNLLLEQKRQKFAQAKAEQLRASARIEYLGVFAEAKNIALSVQPESKSSSVGKNDNYFLKALLGQL